MLKVVVLLLCIFVVSCSISPVKCNFWIPRVGWQGIVEYDYNEAIKDSAAGTKCQANFE